MEASWSEEEVGHLAGKRSTGQFLTAGSVLLLAGRELAAWPLTREEAVRMSRVQSVCLLEHREPPIGRVPH